MESFVPTSARLGQLLVETPQGGAHLEFSIEIEFAEGEFDGEMGTPFLRISHLQVPGRSWRALEQSVWGPDGLDPEDLDGTMLLFRMSNPVEVASIQLGAFQPEGRIPSHLRLVADFEVEAFRDGLDEVEIDLADLVLELQPLRISTRLEKQLRDDEAAIREAIAPIVDLDDYGAMEKVQGGFAFPPKV